MRVLLHFGASREAEATPERKAGLHGTALTIARMAGHNAIVALLSEPAMPLSEEVAATRSLAASELPLKYSTDRDTFNSSRAEKGLPPLSESEFGAVLAKVEDQVRAQLAGAIRGVSIENIVGIKDESTAAAGASGSVGGGGGGGGDGMD